MTYSLNTLTSGRPAAAPLASGWRRFTDELGLLLGFILLLVWLVALFTYSAQDAAWSTSGSGAPVMNRAGPPGAWLADASYYVFGFSVWWCVAAALRTWLTGLARWLRGRDLLSMQPEPVQPPASLFARLVDSRAAFWCALALLLYASASLEWSHLHSLQARLPGHGGGIVGYFAGPLSVRWLGYDGSALMAIALGVLGSARVFHFSWARVAERLGAWLFFHLEARREQREVAQDMALGQQAARAREEVVVVERQDSTVQHPRPVLIEPVLVEVPKSARNAGL